LGRLGEAGRLVENVALDAAAIPDPLSDDNIIGVGIGKQVRRGEIVGGLCVKVYVRRRVPARNSAGVDCRVR
jgi:hypothetical protein